MLKYFYLALISFFVSLFLVGKVFADVQCQPVYGGGQNCITTGHITLNKKVQDPRTSQFVDNLGTGDSRFAQSQSVTFQLILTNTSSASIQNVTLKDIFPGFVSFVSGPGSFDINTKTLTFTTDNLGPGETRTFTLQGKISEAKDLPEGITCVVNQATATTNIGQMGQDNAQLCIEKGLTKGGLPVFPPPKVVTTPPTGPELIPLISLLPGGLAGWFLRKKSSINRMRGGER